ncbi:MAG: glycoside hydrolase family 43 protein [Chloroflexota bacterium]
MVKRDKTHTSPKPIIPGFYPDPSICRVEEDYFLVTSSFEYFPGVPIFHSRDLLNWRQIGHCLTRPSQLPLTVDLEQVHHTLRDTRISRGIWAPTLRYHDGIFYMVTTNITDGRHLLVTTTDPAGEWSEPMYIDLRPELDLSIDPSLMFDADGTVYFTCTGQPQAIHQFEIDVATGEQLSPIHKLTEGFHGLWVEGPHLYHIGEWYYLLTAEGGTSYGHRVSLGRSLSPWGPFEAAPNNPILSHIETEFPVQAVGHGDLVEAHDGSWWLVCLGVRPDRAWHTHHIGRETFLTPIEWSEDSWFAPPNQHLSHSYPAFAEHREHPHFDTPTLDRFTDDTLPLYWNTIRNLDPQAYSLQERPGWLRLHGNTYTLDEKLHAPTFVGRRQQHIHCEFRCKLDFSPENEGEMAGITVLMNERHHYDLFVQGVSSRCVTLRRHVDDMQCDTATVPVSDGGLILIVRASATKYTFAVIDATGEKHLLGSGSVRFLSTEISGGFVGVYFGLFAVANDSHRVTPADFTDVIYQPL